MIPSVLRCLGLRERLEERPKGWGSLPCDIIGHICQHSDWMSINNICLLNYHWRDSVRSHLKKVRLRSFTEIDAATACFPTAVCLVVKRDHFNEVNMQRLASVIRLRSLTLSSCIAMTGPADPNSIAMLSQLTNLEHLELHDVDGPSPQVLDKILDRPLDRLRTLTSLVFKAGCSAHQTAANLPSLMGLARLTGLRSLTVINRNIDQSLRLPGLAHLRCLPHLESLQLQGVGFNDTILADIAASNTCLTRLQLCNEPGVTDGGLALLAKLTNLRVLQLEIPEDQRSHLDPWSITDHGLPHLSALCNLQDLNLSGNFGMSSAGLGFLLHTTGLQKLNLAWLPSPAHGTLRNLAQLSCLHTLCLAYSLASDGQLAVVKSLTSLRVLDLGFTRSGRVTAQSLTNLIRLRMLNLRSCDAMRESHILQIVRYCTALRFLNIDGCNIRGAAVFSIAQSNYRLRFSHQPVQNDSWERPIWDTELRTILHFLNVLFTCLWSCPSTVNVGPNRWRCGNVTSSGALVSELLCVAIVAFFLVFYFGKFFVRKTWKLVFSIPNYALKLKRHGFTECLRRLLASAMMLNANIQRALCLMDQ
eukprot:jgi/Botrbrau1/17272/Bobra.0015s0030.1